MSLEKEFIVYDTHTKVITALGCSPSRREIYLGFEDGIVKSIELDTKTPAQTYWEHKGWITAFLYWPSTKVLFCSSNDGVISVIGSGGIIVDKIFIGQAIYSMVLNNKRKEIILGVSNGLQFHELFETKENFTHYIGTKPIAIVKEHTDIVRNVSVMDSRIYSTGYDGALVIYDSNFSGSAVKFFKNPKAHEAGISCLHVEKDPVENTILVFTGSFDKTVKVWTGEGKIVHKFTNFLTGVTGLCYVPKNKTVCCAAGSSTAFIYDPKSGEEVTDYIDTFVEDAQSSHYLHMLKYLNDFNLMLATTSRKQLLVYRYNSNSCITSLKYKATLDSICFTSKFPILIFTGDSNGSIVKWEQRQSNQLIYGSENLIKSEMVIKESSKMQGQAKKITFDPNFLANHRPDTPLNYYSNKQEIKKTTQILRLVFVESMDLMLAASEDASIYVNIKNQLQDRK